MVGCNRLIEKRMLGRSIIAGVLGFVALFEAGGAEAQIRIIERAQIDSLRHLSTIGEGVMHFTGGTTRSMGQIAEEEGLWVQHVEWENRGDRPLVITRTSSSCSCLVGEPDQRPVKAGEQGCITLRYNPRNHPGSVNQRLLIYTNLSEREPAAILTVVGKVCPMADRRGDYPCLHGTLALRRDTLRITSRGEVRVACMNVGKSPLHLKEDSLLSSRGLKMHTSPEHLEPGQEGDLVIRYRPEPQGEIVGPLRLYIAGLNLPPRRRCVLLIQEEE